MLPPKGNGTFIHDPEESYMEGRKGTRYWVYNPYQITGVKAVDDRLCSYPVYIFQPHRNREDTPIVFALQGMAAPLEWSSFILPTLLDMGIAVVLMDTPLGGLRSVGRYNNGNVGMEISSVTALGVKMGLKLFEQMVEILWEDYKLVHREIVCQRHQLTSDKIALFGVSLGVILNGSIFSREGFGKRLLGTIGHCDVPRFARRNGIEWLLNQIKPEFVGFIPLLRLLKELMDIPDGAPTILNPLFYAPSVAEERQVRFLVGDSDPLLKTKEAKECAQKYKNGECFIVPGLAHGPTHHGPDFVHHVRFFLQINIDERNLRKVVKTQKRETNLRHIIVHNLISDEALSPIQINALCTLINAFYSGNDQCIDGKNVKTCRNEIITRIPDNLVLPETNVPVDLEAIAGDIDAFLDANPPIKSEPHAAAVPRGPLGSLCDCIVPANPEKYAVNQKYFEENQTELAAKYPNEFIAIKDGVVTVHGEYVQTIDSPHMSLTIS